MQVLGKNPCILNDEEKVAIRASNARFFLMATFARHKHRAESHRITLQSECNATLHFFTPNGRVLHAASIWYSLWLGSGCVYKIRPPGIFGDYSSSFVCLHPLTLTLKRTFFFFRKTHSIHTMRCISLFVLALSSREFACSPLLCWTMADFSPPSDGPRIVRACPCRYSRPRGWSRRAPLSLNDNLLYSPTRFHVGSKPWSQPQPSGVPHHAV